MLNNDPFNKADALRIYGGALLENHGVVGATHVAKVFPEKHVLGVVTPLEIGYNKQPTEWKQSYEPRKDL